MNMRHPNLINVNSLSTIDVVVLKNGEYVRARPVSYPSIFQRIYYAWMVFTGKADALVWNNQ
jgi:hypothetical protein